MTVAIHRLVGQFDLRMRLILTFFLLVQLGFAAEPEFPLTADSKPQPGIPQGTMFKDTYTAKEGSVFPGTQREYQIYLPAGLDQSKPAAFMVFQDGVIYQAPVVFDNLIAKKDIPPLIGLFIKPGVVPAANENALPRFNRSYEYDSITPTYSQFLIDEFLPAIEAKHGLKLSTDPNHAAISGNSSGGICAFMTAWHRPDRFRRVFTGVGTYVGIHGADQLPVLVRKFEPKPLRIFLQSGTGDNNLYCGDWWMANQMMERSLTWAGYDVNHAWGEGGHNQKHASQIFPEVLRWLWRDWQTNIEVKANPKGESKWKGYEVVGDGAWNAVGLEKALTEVNFTALESTKSGAVLALERKSSEVVEVFTAETGAKHEKPWSKSRMLDFQVGADDALLGLIVAGEGKQHIVSSSAGTHISLGYWPKTHKFVRRHDGLILGAGELPRDSFAPSEGGSVLFPLQPDGRLVANTLIQAGGVSISDLCLSPDQSNVYATQKSSPFVIKSHITQIKMPEDDPFAANKNGELVFAVRDPQKFYLLQTADDGTCNAAGMCIDTNGWLYVATALGIQVCDQAGRVNFIIPTPKQPYDVCFGGKDLSELFIACGDTIYKRPTKAKGVVSGQQAPIKPPAPKL
jgi:enterochelin esterase-like enzyme